MITLITILVIVSPKLISLLVKQHRAKQQAEAQAEIECEQAEQARRERVAAIWQEIQAERIARKDAAVDALCNWIETDFYEQLVTLRNRGIDIHAVAADVTKELACLHKSGYAVQQSVDEGR